jgi:hypothetical protein
LFSSPNISVGNATTQSPTTFTPNISSPFGLWIEWQNSAYNVAIDNIRFSVVAVVDEPDCAALLLGGLVGLGLAARRKHAGMAKSDPQAGVPDRSGA